MRTAVVAVGVVSIFPAKANQWVYQNVRTCLYNCLYNLLQVVTMFSNTSQMFFFYAFKDGFDMCLCFGTDEKRRIHVHRDLNLRRALMLVYSGRV